MDETAQQRIAIDRKVDSAAEQTRARMELAASETERTRGMCDDEEILRSDSKVNAAVWIRRQSYYEERQDDILRGHNLEKVKITVDEDSDSVFEIQLRWLTRTSTVFRDFYAKRSNAIPGVQHLEHQPKIIDRNGAYLPSINSSTFLDFSRWLQTNCRITPVWATEATYSMEASARRLVNALELGIHLDCAEYQIAAMREFLDLARFLEWPEDYVNSIWMATRAWHESESFKHLSSRQKLHLMHPMRKMIVAIIVATASKGKREIRNGPSVPGVDRGDEIVGDIFWKMVGEYLDVVCRDGECAMPDGIEWFL